MTINRTIDFSGFQVVDYLWAQLIDDLGLEKTKQAVSQALDLQRMNGNKETVPILIVETCGMAISRIATIYAYTGILCNRKGMILILSIRSNALQLICDY